MKIRMWSDYVAVDQDGTVILDFTDNDGNNVSTDADGMPVTLKGFSYVDREGRVVFIEDEFYEDDEGRITQPDTFTGEYSDMPHVLSFLQLSYEDVFNILGIDGLTGKGLQASAGARNLGCSRPQGGCCLSAIQG